MGFIKCNAILPFSIYGCHSEAPPKNLPEVRHNCQEILHYIQDDSAFTLIRHCVTPFPVPSFARRASEGAAREKGSKCFNRAAAPAWFLSMVCH